MYDYSKGIHIYVTGRIYSVDIGGTVTVHLNVVAFICSILVGMMSGGDTAFVSSSVSVKRR